MLEHGADPNAQDALGNSAMHCAVMHNQVGAFRQLQQLGGNPGQLNHRGRSAFTLAAELGRKELFDVMLEALSPYKEGVTITIVGV